VPTCFLLPGVAGSVLGRRGGGGDPIWVSVAQLAAGQIGRLRLGPDGISPGQPEGVQLYAGGPLPDYYGLPAAVLAAGLAPHGYTVVPWGYDWRLSARVTGPMLAGAIRAMVPATDPCTIVAHSFGGLVARVAWQLLGASGDQARVRRLICLGTPHWGSYSPVVAFSGQGQLIAQLTLLALPSYYLGAVPGSGVPFGGWTQERLAAVAGTWPSLYELMPSLLAPDVGSDPLRATLYGNNWLPSLEVSFPRLIDARTVWQPYLTDPSTMPPAWVLTTVGGNGLPTASELVALRSAAGPTIVGYTGAGDGTVPLSSALLPGGAQYTINAAHDDLDQVAEYAADLVGEVLDPRGPPSPPPAPILVDNPLVVYGAAPPLKWLLSGGIDC
jgi:hypothetical protein